MNETLLEVKEISKHFGGVKALDKVNLSIKKGEIHCLVGENGCGKSTLIKVISGFYKPDGGEIKFETKKYWLEKSKLYGKQAILRWLQKENIDTTPNSWQERYHL